MCDECCDLGNIPLKFVNRRDDITLDDDEDTQRVEMSCGHAVSSESLTAFCRSLLDQGKFKLLCPALKDGTLRKCEAEWPYQEVRRVALLSTEEMEHFEVTMARLAAQSYCEFKNCPGCKSFVEREDLSNLNVRCTICTADKQKTYEFCWQCLKKWKDLHFRSDRCGNKGCTNQNLDLLKHCEFSTLTEVEGVTNCPLIRACPTCGNIVEHDNTGCKNIICPRCQVEFCFVCLKLTPQCLETSSYFVPCSGGVAPRQTTIPVWERG